MMKNRIALFIFFGFFLIGVIAIFKYVSFKNHYVSSDAVFVKSDSLTNLSFKLPGKIEKIYVNEGDSVKKGDLLAKLDTKNLEIQKKEIQFNINSLKHKIDSLKIQKEKLKTDISENLKINQANIEKLQDTIKAKEFEISAKTHNLEKLKKDYLRFKRLYTNNKISIEKYEKIKSLYLSLNDEIKADNMLLDSLKKNETILLAKKELILNSKKELLKLQKNIEALNEKLKSLNEKLSLINQNIKDSFLYAPFNGKIAKKFVNSDEVINASRSVLSIVNLNNLYVLDLLEESKMSGIKKGCNVKIHIDALNRDFDGYVDKILPASAATFAILPRDISSGEFTKLAQRFYVRIKFKSIPKNVLVGMSGNIQIAKCNLNN